MTYEEKIIAASSTPRLRRNILSRSAKKLNMEFDAQFNRMTKIERDEFLDAIYPDEKELPDATGPALVRHGPRDPDSSGAPAAEKAETEADSQEQGA